MGPRTMPAMSSDLDSIDAVQRYADEHGGVDGLRTMVALGNLQGHRRRTVQTFLERHDALAREEQDRLRVEAEGAAAIRGVNAAERGVNAAERSAAAAERSAVAGERSAVATEDAARAW